MIKVIANNSLQKSYQISKEGISKSLKYLKRHFYYLPAILLLAIPFAHYIKGKSWEFAYPYGFLLAIAAFMSYEVVPTLIFHLIQWTKSRGFQVLIDPSNRIITFQQDNGQTHSFSFDDLTVTEHLSLYQQNKKRLSTGWSNYSYLKILTLDNKEFQISSLILTRDQFPIEPIETKYSFWPSISFIYKDHQQEINRAQLFRKEQLDKWKTKFSNLTSDELKSRLEKPKSYDELPLMAMKELLKEKSTRQ